MRCGKANTQAPRSLSRLDPVFSRDSSGSSIFFHIKQESSTLATCPAPSSRTLSHVHQAASLPVEQVEVPTLPDGPIVTPRPPVRSAGRYSRKSTEESLISSSRSSFEPPAPSGAVRAASCDFSPMSEGDTTPEIVGPDSHRDPEAWCSRTRISQARTAGA